MHIFVRISKAYLVSLMSGRKNLSTTYLWNGLINIREGGDRDYRWLDNRPVSFANWWFGMQLNYTNTNTRTLINDQTLIAFVRVFEN